MGSNSFLEIEHKFIVEPRFDKEAFLKALKSLSPGRQAKVSVRDTYFVLGHDTEHIYRHRFDREIQQLTVKSVESDAAVRMEINLPIDQSKGDQRHAVECFMKALGCIWQAELAKDIEVSYFDDCEVVLYRATNGQRSFDCVEFEAVNPPTIEDGLSVLSKYEKVLGFDPSERDSRSLFELLLLDHAPPKVRSMFLGKSK